MCALPGVSYIICKDFVKIRFFVFRGVCGTTHTQTGLSYHNTDIDSLGPPKMYISTDGLKRNSVGRSDSVPIYSKFQIFFFGFFTFSFDYTKDMHLNQSILFGSLWISRVEYM